MKSTIIILFLAGAVSASGQTLNARQIVRAELLTDAPDFTRPFTVGIRFKLEKDWYLYWKNPGDSGLPIEVTWDLPDDWTVSGIQYPVPSKFAYGDLVSYGYKKEVVLLAEIIPGKAPPGQIKANLDWLVCKESCIRGKAEVVLSAPVSSGEERAIIANARTKLPLSFENFSISIKGGRLRETGDGWIAELDLGGKNASAVTDFFPEPSDDLLIEFSSIRVEDNVVKFRFEPGQQAKPSVTLKGLFIAGGKGYEASVPFNFNSM